MLDLVWRHSGPSLVAFDGPNFLVKLHMDRVYTVQYIAIFIFGRFGLKLPVHAPFGKVFGVLPWNEFHYCRNPQKNRPWVKTRRKSHKSWKSTHRFDLGAAREKYRKKSQNCNISPIWGEATAERIEMKICIGANLGRNHGRQVQIWKKNQVFWCHGGQNSLFSIDFASGTYHSAALPRASCAIGYISLLLRSAQVTPAISETTQECVTKSLIAFFPKITKMVLVSLLQ